MRQLFATVRHTSTVMEVWTAGATSGVKNPSTTVSVLSFRKLFYRTARSLIFQLISLSLLLSCATPCRLARCTPVPYSPCRSHRYRLYLHAPLPHRCRHTQHPTPCHPTRISLDRTRPVVVLAVDWRGFRLCWCGGANCALCRRPTWTMAVEVEQRGKRMPGGTGCECRGDHGSHFLRQGGVGDERDQLQAKGTVEKE